MIYDFVDKAGLTSVINKLKELVAKKSELEQNSYGEYAGGKNLFDIEDLSTSSSAWGIVHKSVYIPKGTYTLSLKSTTSSEFHFYDASNNLIKKFGIGSSGTNRIYNTLELTEDCYYLNVWINNGTLSDIQIELGTTATSYEPYIKSNYQLGRKTTQIDDANMLGYVLPEEMPIKNYVDSNGVFHQRVGRVDLGSLNWKKDTVGENWAFYTLPFTSYKGPDSNIVPAVNIMCSIYTNESYINIDNVVGYDNTIGADITKKIWVKDYDYTDATAFKNAMKGVYLYYELATEKTISVDGNEYTNTYKADKSEVCVNLLKPTMETVTVNGVTCTNNGDGTFTFDGTASADATFFIKKNVVVKKGTKLVGCPSGGSSSKYFMRLEGFKSPYNNYASDYGSGSVASADTSSENVVLFVRIISGQTVSDLTFKPMLTTDLSATYDDFVPYTGDKGRINEEVAELKNDLGGLSFSASGTTLTITDGTNTWSLTAN